MKPWSRPELPERLYSQYAGCRELREDHCTLILLLLVFCNDQEGSVPAPWVWATSRARMDPFPSPSNGQWLPIVWCIGHVGKSRKSIYLSSFKKLLRGCARAQG